MRVLVIGEVEREAAKRLLEYATKPENVYKPGPNAKVPGDNPNHVLHLWGYRCVFTITSTDQGTYKHLSISVPAKGKMPNPAAVEEIAHLVGITGTVEDWAKKGHVAPNRDENCVVVVEDIKP